MIIQPKISKRIESYSFRGTDTFNVFEKGANTFSASEKGEHVLFAPIRKGAMTFLAL